MWLESQGLTMTEVARRAGIAPATLTLAKHRARMPNLTDRSELAVEP